MSKHRRSRKRNKPRRSIYILPNLLTTASLFGGFYSIISSINGDFMSAAIAILISSVFDFLDGKVARMTQTTSHFGVEYDSLCDLVAFGVAPGVLSYLWALQPYGRLGWVAGFLLVACGALRLARFNVGSGRKKSSFFQGLPIPMAAVMVATTVFMFNYLGQSGPIKNWLVLVMIFVLSFLMVSNFKYFSLKNPEVLRSHPFNTLVAAILVFALVAVRPQVVLFVFSLGYVLSGFVLTAYYFKTARHEEHEEPHELEASESSGD